MPKRIIKAIKKVKHKANQENIAEFLFKNKAILTKLFLSFVILISLYGVFAIFQNSQAKKFSAILHESLIAQQNGDLKTAKEKLIEITSSKLTPSNVNAIAKLRYAGFLIDEGNKKEAGEIYFTLSNCFGCNDYLSDLAGYLAISTWLSDDELMKLDLTKKIAQIHKNSSILKLHIAEQRAFYEMQKNNLEIANKIFDEIIEKAKDNKDLKARAQDGKAMLIQKGFKEKLANEDKDKTKSSKNSDDLKKDSTTSKSQEEKTDEKVENNNDKSQENDSKSSTSKEKSDSAEKKSPNKNVTKKQ